MRVGLFTRHFTHGMEGVQRCVYEIAKRLDCTIYTDGNED